MLITWACFLFLDGGDDTVGDVLDAVLWLVL